MSLYKKKETSICFKIKCAEKIKIKEEKINNNGVLKELFW